MDKREFLKTTGTLVAGSLLSRVAGVAQSTPAPRTNWAGNQTYSTANLQSPATVDELRAALRSATRLRALGTCHSFNTIADSEYEQISVAHLDGIELDEKARTVTLGGGVTYSQLAPWLDERG